MSVASIPALVPVHGGEVTWTDLFCGGGGSSLGIHHVPGMRVRYAINHWDLAIEAHQLNFPDTDHEISDIETVHPSRFARTDCAWFSPSCTDHAYCKGKRDSTVEGQRSRATMWDVCRWTEWHKYDICIVENVIEVKTWCDIHSNWVWDAKKGCMVDEGCRCGVSYDDWISEMHKLGYQEQEVYFNSQHALVPQSRDRMYIVFHRRGIKAPDLDFTPPCYCTTCEKAVAGIQTWKKPAKRSRRANPRLARWGKYGKRNQYIYTCPECTHEVWPAVVGAHDIIDHTVPIQTIGERAAAGNPLVVNTRKRIKVGVESQGELTSVQLQIGGNLFERPGKARLWSLGDPFRTLTTSDYMAVILRYGGQATAPRTAMDPMMAITAHDRQIGLIVPQRSGSVPSDEAVPTPAVTTAETLSYVMRYGSKGASAPGEPSPTVTTADDMSLVMQNMNNNIPRTTGVPGPPVTTGGNQVLITLRKNASGQPMGQPVPSIAASGTHHGMLVYNGSPGHVRSLEDAAGTVKTRDSQSLIYPGSSQPQQILTGPVTEEMIDEMYFRMLEAHELQRAQGMHALPDGSPYLLDVRVRRANGKYTDISKQDKVRMIGNAVSSPVAELLVRACSTSLAAT